MSTPPSPQAPPNGSRTFARIALAAAPILFGGQIVLEALAIGPFREMFLDFGSTLPRLTTLVITYQYLWLGLGLFGPALAIGTLFGKGNARLRRSLLAGAGIIEFVLAQTILFALFQPVIGLGSVIEGR